MKHDRNIGRFRGRGKLHWLAPAAAGIATLVGNKMLPAAASEGTSSVVVRPWTVDAFAYGHEDILGTSLDLFIEADCAKDADACQQAIFSEIERLRSLLSTYDPASEISRYCQGAPIESAELQALLAEYATWNARTRGAIDANMAGVVRVWKEAERLQSPPTQSELLAAHRKPRALNVDALGKGYIVDRAVELAARMVPAGLLNIGGDLRAWGNHPWDIGVADPFAAGDNGPPLARMELFNGAIATSGGYMRFYRIGGDRYSHVLDPRTLRPVDHIASATVVARDCLTANALSTAACVLSSKESADVLAKFGDGYLIVDRGGNRSSGRAFESNPTFLVEFDQDAPAESEAPPESWPENHQVTVELSIRGGFGRRGGFKRPYMALWVEDAEGKIVRTVAVWGREAKYVRELSYWVRAVGGLRFNVRSITSATRPPGKYSLVWDGKDDEGQPVPMGKYKIVVEINREHGGHTRESVDVECGTTPATYTIRQTAESDESSVTYGPAESK